MLCAMSMTRRCPAPGDAERRHEHDVRQVVWHGPTTGGMSLINLSSLWWNVPRGKGTYGHDARRFVALRAPIAVWLRMVGRMPPAAWLQ
jgi:hypothetical protein